MKALFTVWLILFYSSGFATTYYISPKGSDSEGNGSSSNPWRSLFKATAAVTTAGDIIHVNGGNYLETQQCSLAVGVSIEGEGNSSVIQSTLTADFTEIISLHSPEGTNGNQHISNLKLDGQNLSTFLAIWISGRSNVSINNCVITDFKDRGIIFDGRNDNLEFPPLVYAKGNLFHDNIVTNCAAYNTPNGIYGRGCLNIGGQDGMLIYNNTITQNSRPKGYNGFTIKYSNDGYLKAVKIYNNILTKIPFSGNFGGDNGWDFAVELWNIIGGVEIYGNSIEGAVDFANSRKTTYDYSVWFHDNKVFQKTLNSFYESGVIFETTTESVIVENNVFDKISAGILFNAQENTILSDIIIRKNIFSNIGRNTGNGNNGSGINFNCGTLFGNNLHYTINNVSIFNNIINAATGNAPYYGIEITGGRLAKNIKIQDNTITNFRVACIIVNPGYIIDTLSIERNKLSVNGNHNNPFFISGAPRNYYFKNNTKSTAGSGSVPAFSFREQLARPVYYEIRLVNLLECIGFFAGILCVFFYRKENIYGYPAGLISIVIYIFIRFDQDLPGEVFMNLYFVAMGIYGWRKWLKRDRRGHRIIRITASTKREVFIQLTFFALAFLFIFITLSYFKNYFAPGTVLWADAFANASAFTGILLITKKKVESWYYWIAGNLTFIYVYYERHYLLISSYFVLLLLLTLWCLSKWKRKRINKRNPVSN